MIPSFTGLKEFTTNGFNLNYAEITKSDVDESRLTVQSDIIGYDWKFFNLSEGTYTILADQNYILEDQLGFFHKIHFTGFYNGTGEKGYPLIAHQKI